MTSHPQAKSLLSSITGVPVGQIPNNASISSFPEWDSIVHMELLSIVETKIGRELSEAEMVELGSLRGLDELLTAFHLGDRL